MERGKKRIRSSTDLKKNAKKIRCRPLPQCLQVSCSEPVVRSAPRASPPGLVAVCAVQVHDRRAELLPSHYRAGVSCSQYV